MVDYVDRLIAEYDELCEKQYKLEKFFGSYTFDNLSTKDKELLYEQVLVMKQYQIILHKRISNV